MEPRIQYAKTTDGVNIAYAVLGSGPPMVGASNVWGSLHLTQAPVTARLPIRSVVDGLVARARKLGALRRKRRRVL